MDIRILGAHNSAAGPAGCVTLLIDRRLVIDAGSVASALSIAEQGMLEAVLLSHQHYDHVRDLPLLALNLFRRGQGVTVYGARMVLNKLETHLFNDELYPRFHRIPEGHPTLRLKEFGPLETRRISGYEVRAVPVNHGAGTLGYQITDAIGNALFYAADTGAGLSRCWQEVSPQLLLIEVTLPDRYREYAVSTQHLTPAMLYTELDEFRRMKGYLPRVVGMHLDPSAEDEIKAELGRVAERLEVPITVAYEGMELSLEPSKVLTSS